jgi:serine palmitoyltransferase
VIESVKGNFFTLQGYSKPVLNLTTFDFLGLAQHPATKKASLEAVNKYGVGSCGPRGFYGTIDVHLLLENKLAQFMGFEVYNVI